MAVVKPINPRIPALLEGANGTGNGGKNPIPVAKGKGPPAATPKNLTENLPNPSWPAVTPQGAWKE